MHHEIRTPEALIAAIESSREKPALFFKHSISCGVSSRAFNEFQKFLQSPYGGRVDNYLIVVQTARGASDELADLTGIPHESPQAILIRDGRAVWNESHLALRMGAFIEGAKIVLSPES